MLIIKNFKFLKFHFLFFQFKYCKFNLIKKLIILSFFVYFKLIIQYLTQVWLYLSVIMTLKKKSVFYSYFVSYLNRFQNFKFNLKFAQSGLKFFIWKILIL